MKDLQIARERLNSGDCSLVVVKNRVVIAERQGAGIRPLLETAQELGKGMEGSSVADKVIGKAAAMLCIDYGVIGIYTPVLGSNAQAILKKYKLDCIADKVVPSILNRDGTDSCPLEKITANMDSPDGAIIKIKQFLEAGARGSVMGK